ncbi:MAG TPA: patatin-like protein, partial [Gaiellaceae bacterium]
MSLSAGNQAASQPPKFEPAQELRLALVLYGGVSLAIYINGVVQELFNLVRATAPERAIGSDPEPERVAELSEAELNGTPGVYRELGRLLRWGDPAPNDFDDKADPVIRTRFLVDIISGTSAGGINGVFLGKALANEQAVDGLKRLWVEEGDILRLINDRTSIVDLRKLPLRKPPRSVLNSERFYTKALEALSQMGDDLQRDSSYVDELDLWITATDLPGLAEPIKLFDRVVWESRHRNVFHFAYWNAYATGGGRNDFVRANDPFMAFAARCTSSFPVAFQPMTLSDIDDVVATFPQEYPRESSDSDSPAWRAFFDDYVQMDAFYKERAFADGGYLDNKPFTYATRALLRRRADVPVDRKLIYIEPDPGHPEAEYVSRDPPDALHNLQAVFTLPRAETIREDLDALLERNRLIRR